MAHSKQELGEAVRIFVKDLLNRCPNVTYEELDAEFQKTAKGFCDEGVLRVSRDMARIHDLPLEWETIRIFQRIVELDSRKVWSQVILPKGQDQFTYDFIVRRGSYVDDLDTVQNLPDLYLVFEVKSHKNGGATIEDLRQLEDWVGRLNRKHQENLTSDNLKTLLNVIHTAGPIAIDSDDRVHISETTRLIPFFFPYKGVFVINHAWGRDDRGRAFGANEIQFAKERRFCLMTFEDLLIFKQAIEDYEIDSWFFLEELEFVDGVLDLDCFSGHNLSGKYK